MWNRNFRAAWVGMQASTAIVENSTQVPQNLELELSRDPALPLPGAIHRGHERRCQEDACARGYAAFAQQPWYELPVDEWTERR
jgi:hypothetical protein